MKIRKENTEIKAHIIHTMAYSIILTPLLKCHYRGIYTRYIRHINNIYWNFINQVGIHINQNSILSKTAYPILVLGTDPTLPC